MATREDKLRQLAILCRRNHSVALWVIAYLSGDCSTTQLESLVEGAVELDGVEQLRPLNHYAAFVERFGVPPGR